MDGRGVMPGVVARAAGREYAQIRRVIDLSTETEELCALPLEVWLASVH